VLDATDATAHFSQRQILVKRRNRVVLASTYSDWSNDEVGPLLGLTAPIHSTRFKTNPWDKSPTYLENLKVSVRHQRLLAAQDFASGSGHIGGLNVILSMDCSWAHFGFHRQ
jgi:hypothetical protein